MERRKDGKGRVLRKGEYYRKTDVKYSDVLYFYTDLVTNKGLQINTLESVNTVLRPTFQLAVRDNIIRKSPFFIIGIRFSYSCLVQDAELKKQSD